LQSVTSVGATSHISRIAPQWQAASVTFAVPTGHCITRSFGHPLHRPSGGSQCARSAGRAGSGLAGGEGVWSPSRRPILRRRAEHAGLDQVLGFRERFGFGFGREKLFYQLTRAAAWLCHPYLEAALYTLNGVCVHAASMARIGAGATELTHPSGVGVTVSNGALLGGPMARGPEQIALMSRINPRHVFLCCRPYECGRRVER
jgi:hypothetical protein